jgi:trimethylamine--corrinoid protein Co-methyltransferase
LASCLAGADLLCGAGLLFGARVFSLEEMVLDCEIFGLLRHLVGVPQAVAEEESSAPLLEEVGPGGHFLSQPHTLQHMRQQWMPRLFDRTSWEEWTAGGGPGPRQAAGERVREILQTHEPEPLDDAVEGEILNIIEAYEQQGGEPGDG